MKYILLLPLLLLINSCVEDILPTDTEVKAVDEVLAFYGGVCNRSKGFETFNGKKTKHFTLEMSRSELIEYHNTTPGLPASNVAYIFYRNLDDEQKNYDEIRVNILLDNGNKYEYSYSGSTLSTIEEYEYSFHQLVGLMKSKDYESISILAQGEYKDLFTTEGMEKFCHPFDSIYGNVLASQMHGFSTYNSKDNGHPIVHISGVLKREKEHTAISIFFDTQENSIASIKHSFY